MLKYNVLQTVISLSTFLLAKKHKYSRIETLTCTCLDTSYHFSLTTISNDFIKNKHWKAMLFLFTLKIDKLYEIWRLPSHRTVDLLLNIWWELKNQQIRVATKHKRQKTLTLLYFVLVRKWQLLTVSLIQRHFRYLFLDPLGPAVKRKKMGF